MSYKKTLPAQSTIKVLNALEALQLPGLKDYEPEKRKIKAHITEAERKGLEKYGHTMDRDDLDRDEWIQHLLEELCDGAQYAHRAGLPSVMTDLLKMAVIIQNMK